MRQAKPEDYKMYEKKIIYFCFDRKNHVFLMFILIRPIHSNEDIFEIPQEGSFRSRKTLIYLNMASEVIRLALICWRLMEKTRAHRDERGIVKK